MNGWFTSFLPLALALAILGPGTSGLNAQAVMPVATALRSYDKGFREPVRLATDESGHLYVADPRLGAITVRDESGRFIAIKRGFHEPLGVAVDASGRIFVCEAGKGRVSVFTSGWVPAGALGQGDGEFQMPNHLQITPDGLVYVVDSLANQVKIFSSDNQLLRQFGGPGTLAGQFKFPTGLSVAPTGEIFVSDQGNERIQVFDTQGNFLRKFGGPIGMLGSNTTFGRIQGLLVDSQGRLLMADSFRGVVVVANAATGAILGNIGAFGSDPGKLFGPASLVVDRNNRLFVATPGNTRVEIFGLDAYTDPHILSAILTLRTTTFQREDEDRRRGDEVAPLARSRRSQRGRPNSMFVPELRGLVPVLIQIPGVDPSTIQPHSITANGVPASHVPGAFIGDFNGNGHPAYLAWFSQDRLVATMPDGNAFLVVSGRLADGRFFESLADVNVTNPTGSAQ